MTKWVWERRFKRIEPNHMELTASLSLFANLRENGNSGRFLVICPLSVLPSWMNEIARWTPSFKAIRMHGVAAERVRLISLCKENEYDIYVTSYEQFVLEKHWFTHRPWTYIVVDEGKVLAKYTYGRALPEK